MGINYLSLFLSIVTAIVTGAIGGWAALSFKAGRYAQSMDDLKKSIEKISNKLEAISDRLTKCETKIDERTISYPATLTKKESPLSLTNEGQNLLKRSGGDKYILENKDELIQKIKSENPQTAYDVQVLARKVVEELKTEPKFNKLKDFAYGEGIDLEPIFIVMGIYLRDIALPILNFKPEDIDKNDPSK